ncbi:MAG TPA: hypothetical protein VGP92_08175 [Acidimicrobiia bacterium]|nr:hypothetical protein [Acidimicrobiia bacterium]
MDHDESASRPTAEPDPPLDGDAVEHLWNAAHEMLRAIRTLLDAAEEFVDAQRSGRPPSRSESGSEAAERGAGRVHRIDIDARHDAGASAADTETARGVS